MSDPESPAVRRFHIAWEDGRYANQMGRPRDGCPYRGPLADQWHRGWLGLPWEPPTESFAVKAGKDEVHERMARAAIGGPYERPSFPLWVALLLAAVVVLIGALAFIVGLDAVGL